MANDVTHIVVVTGEPAAVYAFKGRCITTKTERDLWEKKTWTTFDFGILAPIPDDIRSTGSRSTVEYGLNILAYNEGNPEQLKSMLDRPRFKTAGIASVEKLRDTILGWHPNCVADAEHHITLDRDRKSDWVLANWGSHSCARDYVEISNTPGRFEFSFDTAWSPPEFIFDRLADEFPNLTFEIICFEEYGHFAGEGSITGGVNTFHTVQANAELYERVFGSPPDIDVARNIGIAPARTQ